MSLQAHQRINPWLAISPSLATAMLTTSSSLSLIIKVSVHFCTEYELWACALAGHRLREVAVEIGNRDGSKTAFAFRPIPRGGAKVRGGGDLGAADETDLQF